MSTVWSYGSLLQGGSESLLPRLIFPNTFVSVNTFGAGPPNDNGHLVLRTNFFNIITDHDFLIFTSTVNPPTVTYNYPLTGNILDDSADTFPSGAIIFNEGLRLEITSVSITFRSITELSSLPYTSNSAFGVHYSTYMHHIDLPDVFGTPTVTFNLNANQWTANNSYGRPFTMGAGFTIELDWVAFEYSYASYDLKPSPIFDASYTVSNISSRDIDTPTFSIYDAAGDQYQQQAFDHRAIKFSPDGLRAYLLDNWIYSVFQVDLTEPYKLSTATYNGQLLFDQALSGIQDMSIHPDGNTVYILRNGSPDRISIYTLTEAWNVNTAIIASNTVISGTFLTNDPRAFEISPDGNTMFLLEYGNKIVQVDMSESWNLQTGVQGTEFSLGAFSDPSHMTIDNSGQHLYYYLALDGELRHMYMKTPWDLSTGVVLDQTDAADVWFDTYIYSLWINNDGTEMIYSDSNLAYYQIPLNVDKFAQSWNVYTTIWPSSSFGPIEDISVGTWTNELDSNVDIYTSIDETTANNQDYIKSAYLTPSANDVYECRLPPVRDPVTSNNHFINYTIQAHTIDGTVANLTVSLVQNTTIIASWFHENVTEEYVYVSQALTPSEIDSITDYGDLRIRFEAST